MLFLLTVRLQTAALKVITASEDQILRQLDVADRCANHN